MQVEEMVSFIAWVDDELRTKNNILSRYQVLQNILAQNANPQQPKSPFEIQKNALLEALNGVDLSRISETQIRFGKKIGLIDLVGPVAVSKVEDILFRNSLPEFNSEVHHLG